MPLRHRTARLVATVVLLAALAGSAALVYRARHANPFAGYQKYSESFFDAFDTVTTVVVYAKSEAEFRTYYDIVEPVPKLHRLYDIYNTYPGINNLKTVNDNAGVAPLRLISAS